MTMAIPSRDDPLLAFMSSVAGALGMDGIFRMREPGPPGGGGGSGSAAAGGGETMEGVLSRDAATKFYEDFLVPRFVASSDSDMSSSSSSSSPSAAGVDALKAIAEIFLLAEDGEMERACVVVPWA